VAEKSQQQEDFEEIKEKAKARIEEERQAFSDDGQNQGESSPNRPLKKQCDRSLFPL
jgi:hypothetical protein